jgi:hypothetical protein
MRADPLDDVIRGLIWRTLDDDPALLPQDRRYADPGGQRVAKDQIAARIAQELAANGFLPLESNLAPGSQNFQAVSYTIGRMRRRLLKPVAGGGDDPEAERLAHQAIAISFFGDLEEQGWRLVRIRQPVIDHSTCLGPCS